MRRRRRKERSGSNRSGLLSNFTRWYVFDTESEFKRHEQQHNTSNRARQQAIKEQAADVYEDDHSAAVELLPQPGRHEVGYEYDLEDMPSGVTFNGEPAEHYATDTWDPYCWCSECAIGRDLSAARGMLAFAEAELIVLRNENEVLKARVNFLEAKHGYI